MPELAEVETVRRVLINWVKDKKVVDIECYYPLILENCTIENLKNALINKKCIDILRHGKHLIFDFGEYYLLSHLRMEGKYFRYNDDSYKSKHNHLIFKLDDGSILAYNDTRKFGRFNLCKKEDLYTDSIISSLGKEPFDANYLDLYNKAISYRGTIKEFLLDQHVMAGLGNIYVDEVCFETKLLPYLKASILTKDDCKKIIDSSIRVLNKAIELGGSTIHSFTSGNGVDGRFQNELNVYGKENMPCNVCSNPLTKTLISSRSTVFCPCCQTQINISKPKVIGISGLIASGKTFVLNSLKEYGYEIIDCDCLVKEAYANKLIEEQLLNEFKTSDKSKIRDIVKNNKKELDKLEDIIHPYVIDRIKEYIKRYSYLAFEASQLFESKLSKLCDFTIFVTCEDKIRMKRLKLRNPNNFQDYLYLNNDSNDGYKKIKLSSYTINTTLGSESVLKQIKDMCKKFI